MKANGPQTLTTIIRDGQFLFVQPPSTEILQPYLQTARRKYHADGGCTRVKSAPQPMYERASFMCSPALKCWAGLTRPVQAAFEKNKQFVRTKVLYHLGLPIVDPAALSSRCQDVSAVQFVADNDRGLISHRAGLLKTPKLLAQIIQTWPDLNVTVRVSCKDNAYSLADELRTHGIPCTAFTHKHRPSNTEARVAISTYLHLAANAIEPEKQNLVFCMDALEATAIQARYCLEHLEAARLYGFIDAERRLSLSEQDAVHELFGFDVHEFARHGHDYLPIEVAWSDAEGRRLQQKPANDLELKRYGIWRQDSRNRQIARFAQKTAQCQGEHAGRCVVLVENIEHLLGLMPKLPDWPISLGDSPYLEGIDASKQDEIARRRVPSSEFPSRVIMTLAGLSQLQLGFKENDVLIRGDGGRGSLNLKLRTLAPASAEGHDPVTIMDFFDRHDARLEAWSHERVQAYCDADWPMVNSDPTSLRVVKFMKSRPIQGAKKRRQYA